MLTGFDDLSTPLIADACVRLAIELRAAPSGVHPVIPGQRLVGRACPVRHYGSVDIFFEALEGAGHGDVLVIDNGGRVDEACIGDLVVLEAEASRLTGLIVWGLHRDTADLVEIGLPVFSYGSNPLGPMRLDEREPDALSTARFGDHLLSSDDVAFADDDGIVFVPEDRVAAVLEVADHIFRTERDQARKIRAGETLRQQTVFSEYLTRRAEDPNYTFRHHLRRVGGAIEE